MAERENMMLIKNFQSEGFTRIFPNNQRISQSFKYLCLLLSFIVILERSHFMLREQSYKRVKISDFNEIVASREQNDVENSELNNNVQELKKGLKEFKIIQLENLKK